MGLADDLQQQRFNYHTPEPNCKAMEGGFLRPWNTRELVHGTSMMEQ
jgi:hypothetical protein